MFTLHHSFMKSLLNFNDQQKYYVHSTLAGGHRCVLWCSTFDMHFACGKRVDTFRRITISKKHETRQTIWCLNTNEKSLLKGNTLVKSQAFDWFSLFFLGKKESNRLFLLIYFSFFNQNTDPTNRNWAKILNLRKEIVWHKKMCFTHSRTCWLSIVLCLQLWYMHEKFAL